MNAGSETLAIDQRRLGGTTGMNEVIFLVEEAPEGGYTARALGASIFTEADDLPSLHEQVRDAVRCHFEADQAPRLIRLHFVKEEVLAV
jgi:hypothetical protein